MSHRVQQALRRRAGAALGVLALSATRVWAQGLGPLPTVSTRADLPAVEAEATSYPELPPAHLDPLFWRENVIPGDAERRCVVVPEQGPVRSGDFAIWYNGLERPRAGKEHKVAWVPSENAREMALRVRGRRVGDPNASFDWTSANIGRTLNANRDPDAPDRDWFFPSGTTFPQAGEWVVVATSGRNWGCFVFLVTEASSTSGAIEAPRS